MSFSRLSRFRRSNEVPPLQITERDREIIRLVWQHRFLRSSHCFALLESSEQPVLRRLQLLYHHGYLTRPRAQLDYYHQGGSRSIVYGLAPKGWKLIEKQVGCAPQRFTFDDQQFKRIFLEHSLLVSDIMVAVELACRQRPNVRFISQTELKATNQKPRPFRWQAKLENNLRVTVEPDQVFALEFLNGRGAQNRVLFFLEADRGTMPVKRARVTQSSFHRKLIGYEATWTQWLHRKRFGFHRFRVITVTTIPGRVQSLIDSCSELKASGLFLFAHQSILETPTEILSTVWRCPQSEEPESLLS